MPKPRGTDGSLLSSLPWTQWALAFSIAPHVLFLPIWISVAFVGCSVWRYLIERRRGALPPTWLRGVLALLSFLGVLVTYETISGVGPGSALLAVMASLKMLETRKRRDQFVLLFIAVFLVMATLLREQYLWSLPYLIIALAIIMTAWLRMAAEPGEPIVRSFRTGARLMAYAAPLAIAMWIFFPRISVPFWAVPIDTSSGVSGLSNSMSPGDISSLSLSNAVAFRARFFDAVPEPRDRYWRAMVLHRFNGRTWNGSEPVYERRSLSTVEVRGDPVRYEITMEPTGQQWIPALEMPDRWDLPRTFMGRMQQLTHVYPIDQRIAFEMESYTEYQVDRDLSQYLRGWYLDLPEGFNPRTVELARTMLSEAGSRTDYINAVVNMFNVEEFYYTLRPPELGVNSVDEFLFNTRQGFCEHYASAFAFMMRAAGIPSRVILGFQGGEINPMGGRLIVRQSDAHAWTEIWLAGTGWLRIDPTAAVAPQRIEVGFTDSLFDGAGARWGLTMPSQFLHQLQLTWDALNASWNDLILGYGPEKQSSFMQLLGMDNPTWRKMLLTLIALVVALTLIISLVMHLRNGPPNKDRAAILYDRFIKKTKLPPTTGETPAAYALRLKESDLLDDDTVDTVTNLYLAARYGESNGEELTQLEHEVAAIRAHAALSRREQLSTASRHQ